MLKMLSVKRVNPPCFKDLLADIQRITLIACTLPHKDKHKSISPFYFLLRISLSYGAGRGLRL